MSLPRPVSIFDDDFDKLASKAADTDFYMSAPPGETYRQGQLLGIVVKGQHVHTGRNDPHVLAVRQLLKMADANAREPRMTPDSASAAMSFQVQVAGDQYTYPYLYTLTTIPFDDGGGGVWTSMQGFRTFHDIKITRTINQASAGWFESPVLPIMVGAWGTVNIDPDSSGGLQKPRGYA